MGRAAPHQRGSRASQARQQNKCACRRSAHPSSGVDAITRTPPRAQKRAAGTRRAVLFGIVNSRRAPLRRSHPNVSNRRRLPAAAWPRACRMPRRATRIAGAGGYPSAPAPCIFPVIYRCGSLDCTLRVLLQRAYGASYVSAGSRIFVEFTLGPREARTRGLAQARSLHSPGTRGQRPSSCAHADCAAYPRPSAIFG